MANILKTFRESIKYWYIPLIIGILLTVFGIYLFTVPMETYFTLAMLFSISFIVSGLLDIVFSIQNHRTLGGWGWYLVGGILTFALGIYLVTYPEIPTTILPFVVGFTLLFRSFLALGYSFDLREMRILSWGNVALASVAGIIFSFLLLASPFFTGLSLVVITALSFIFVGIASIVLSLNLKKIKDTPEKISSELKERIYSVQKEIEQQFKK